jgi:hypothetical protein
MRVLVKFQNGVSDVFNLTKVNFISKNPCLKCRPDGGCYEHSCFNSEDWGDFLDLGNGESIKMDDVELIRILEL